MHFGSVLLTAAFLKSDFSGPGQHYPFRFSADPDDQTCDKQITKLVYPGIVFPWLFLQPQPGQQQGALIAHLRDLFNWTAPRICFHGDVSLL